MKTMETLIRRFNRRNAPTYRASLDPIDSYPGYYVVYVSDPVCVARYSFKSCRDFREWMDGVSLD